MAESVKNDLTVYLEKIRRLYDKDRSNNVAGVYMPMALDRKYPNAGKEWIWFWVFPSESLASDPISGVIRRHHRLRRVPRASSVTATHPIQPQEKRQWNTEGNNHIQHIVADALNADVNRWASYTASHKISIDIV